MKRPFLRCRGPGRALCSFSPLAGTLLFAILAAGDASAQFDDVLFFGDSLSDTGIACAAVSSIEGRYFPGRCSNGPVWSEQFAALLGHDAVPAPVGGDNYAVGGAQALSASNQLSDQIDLYLASPLGGLFGSDPNALYVLWIGGNDVLAVPPMADLSNRVLAVIDAMERLHDNSGLAGSGARNFLIPNLPDLGRTHGSFNLANPGAAPAWSDMERSTLSSLSTFWNQELAAELAALPASYRVFTLDLFSLIEEATIDPATFGLVPGAIATSAAGTDYGLSCLADAACAAASPTAGLPLGGSLPDGFLLFDGIHPTTRGHAEIADRAFTAVPEPKPFQTGAIAITISLLVHGRRRSPAPSASERRRASRAAGAEPFGGRRPRRRLGVCALVLALAVAACATPGENPQPAAEATTPEAESTASELTPPPGQPPITQQAPSTANRPRRGPSPLGYVGAAPQSWQIVDRSFLEANPQHAARATAAATEQGREVGPLVLTFQQIASGLLEIYFLPHPQQRDTIEVRTIPGTIPREQGGVDEHCRDVRAQIEAENQGPVEIQCALTKYGPNTVFIVQNAQRPDVEVTIFQLQNPENRVLTLTARLDPRTSLNHARAIRDFVASLRLAQ